VIASNSLNSRGCWWSWSYDS